jgi:SHAQKYF class myb-like DNA-binding protein
MESSLFDLDAVLQWSEMQRMDDCETEDQHEEEAIGSSDDLSASDIMLANAGDLSDLLVPSVRGSSFTDPLLSSGGVGGESLLSGDGIRPLLDPRHLLNAARADVKVSSLISSLLQSLAAGANLEESLSGHEELQSFLPRLLVGSRPDPISPSMDSLYGQSWSHEDDDDDEEEDEHDAQGPNGKAGRGKTRFVWSAELHARFEQAVAELGVDRARPQAISQLMLVEGENAPTRQNIKSHLQRYRMLRQKRTAQAAES